jgi:hypothetical protein
MKLVAATAITAAPKNNGDAQTVSAVDRDAGTVTMDVDVTALSTAWAAADELFREGATAFFGVDRSVDTQRLGGVRYSGSGVPLHEALVNGQTAISKWGGRPTHVFIAFDRMRELINLLGSKVEYTEHKVADIGFEGIVVRGPRGKMTVFADINCPPNHAYLLTLSDWKLKSLNAAPHILKYKGSGYLHEATADGIEIRVGLYGNVMTKAPGRSGVITSFGS